MEKEKQIDEILRRSVKEVLPNKEDLKKLLLGDKKIRIYVGADATGPELHLGHSTNFLILERLRKLGHEVVVLFGDFTAMIGDPTDKEATRKQLTIDEVNQNIRLWKDQVSKIVDFKDKNNPAVIKRNSEWLSKLNFADVINISSNFTVQYMLERDMFEKRMNEGKPVYLHEFFYPLMQGFDSVVLKVDLELGGTDQTFNMLAGRSLSKKYNNKEKFVLSTTLLENPITGKKLMSKSEGNYIALNAAPNDMYGKIMALPDGIISQMFVDCTNLGLEEISNINKDLAENKITPKEHKMILARTIVEMYHSKEEAVSAEASFINTFSKGEIPKDVKTVKVKLKVPLVDILIKNGLVASKSEFRRLVQEGAITFHGEIEEKKIIDPNSLIDESGSLKIGKRRFLKIQITKK